MSISQRDIDQAYSDLHATCGGHKNDYFALLYLQQEFGIPQEVALTHVAFGNHDYGFDAFHFDREKRNLYLYQFKWSDSHDQFKDSLRRLIDAGFQRIFAARDQDRRQNDLLQQLHSCLRENYNVIDQICLHFVFKGDPARAEASQTLESLCEDLENKKHLIDSFFNRQVIFVIEYRSSATAKVGATSHQIRTRTYRLKLDQVLSGFGPQGQKMQIAFVPLVNLMSMYRDMGKRFFERNIRGGLQPDKFVNRELTRSFKAIVEGTQPPSLFAFNHNGVTLAAEAVVEGEYGEYEIIEPRLLNGAQTVTTLERFLTLREGDEALKGASLEDVRVLCKIITNGDAAFVNRVTLNNNRQNAVAPWNLHANDTIQLELADKFRDDLQIFYERQENAFAGLTDDELSELSITLELVPLARTFLASDGHIDRLSNLTQVFEDEKQYAQVFNDGRLRADSRHIVLCYKVQRRLGKAIKDIEDKAVKYAFVRRARNLVWALLCQAILNYDDLPSYSERYGKSLTAEADYTQWITHLAVTRVGPSLWELVTTNEGYKNKLADNKLDFLRTNSAYNQCMDIAYTKWHWVKKRLAF
jgi:hypothetical protein